MWKWEVHGSQPIPLHARYWPFYRSPQDSPIESRVLPALLCRQPLPAPPLWNLWRLYLHRSGPPFFNRRAEDQSHQGNGQSHPNWGSRADIRLGILAINVGGRKRQQEKIQRARCVCPLAPALQIRKRPVEHRSLRLRNRLQKALSNIQKVLPRLQTRRALKGVEPDWRGGSRRGLLRQIKLVL